MNELIVRGSLAADLSAIADIYSHHVMLGTATFETVPPDLEEIARRRHAVLSEGLPYLVAESNGVVVGYAYAALYRPRPAYRFTVEDSIYIHADHLRKGIGRLLLTELLRQCELGRWRQMIAIIGDSGNASSIRLHQELGFTRRGLSLCGLEVRSLAGYRTDAAFPGPGKLHRSS